MNLKPKTLNTFYSNGKLLLTGEYLVLDGALSLAVPTKFGQSLTIKHVSKNKLTWKSIDVNEEIWFEEEFSFEQITYPFVFECCHDEDHRSNISKTLLKILFTANQLNKQFLTPYTETNLGIEITTSLDFPKNWGLGTSSTLINNIANWANVDAYRLLELTFGGSGYDIACAQNDSSILYILESKNEEFISSRLDRKPKVVTVKFNPTFKKHLYFVHLNKKQNSREGILQYEKNKINASNYSFLEIDSITRRMLTCDLLSKFEELLTEHEKIISKIIKQKPIKELLFSDFNGSIKSLGAWGGDFVLVASKSNPTSYFNNKGFKTVISYDEMILNNSKK